MSKLDDLIQEYCPDGVEYKKLGEIASISRGGHLQKKDFVDNGIPCIHYGQIYTKYGLSADKTFTFVSEESAQKQRYAETNDIIMAVTSENLDDVCKCVAWLGKEKVAVSGHTAIIHHSQNAKYMSYYFYSSHFQIQKNKLAHGTKVIEVTPSKLENIVLPVPPLEVQREIVRILDSFTLLTAELTAELTARQNQYEYYRDKLLKCENIVPRVRLGDICSVITKGTTPKKYVDKGISFIKTESFNGTRIDLKKISYIDEFTHNTFLKRSILEENDILITIAGATIGKCLMVPKEVLPANTNQALAIIRVKKYTSCKYVMYVLQSYLMKKYIQKNIKGSAQPNLNLQQLNDFIIPLPTLETQKRIVHVLDNFEKICSDLNIGLPAEISARQKQYEYYRDALLTFAAKGDIIVNRTEQNRTEHQYELIRLIQYVFGFVTVQLKDVADVNIGKKPNNVYKDKNKYEYINAGTNNSGYTDSFNCDGDTVTTPSRGQGGIGYVGYQEKPFWLGPLCYNIRSKNPFILNKYIYYSLSSGKNYILALKKEGGTPALNMYDLLSVKITIPLLDEQKRIVDILDRFYALCNDLTCGLPAEIAARQKQYEYYRDKLLTFKEAK